MKRGSFLARSSAMQRVVSWAVTLSLLLQMVPAPATAYALGEDPAANEWLVNDAPLGASADESEEAPQASQVEDEDATLDESTPGEGEGSAETPEEPASDDEAAGMPVADEADAAQEDGADDADAAAAAQEPDDASGADDSDDEVRDLDIVEGDSADDITYGHRKGTVEDIIVNTDGVEMLRTTIAVGGNQPSEDGIYHYLTGESSKYLIAINNEDNMTLSKVVRVYFSYDHPGQNMGSFPARDNIYNIRDPNTGDTYPMKVVETDIPNVFYYDLTGIAPGRTLAFDNSVEYQSPGSPGGNLRVWAYTLTPAEAEEYAGKVISPADLDYLHIVWETKPITFGLSKTENTVNGSNALVSVPLTGDAYVRMLQWRISESNTSGSSSSSLGQDHILSVDYSDEIELPEQLSWREGLIAAIEAGETTSSSGEDGWWYTTSSQYMNSSSTVSVPTIRVRANGQTFDLAYLYKYTSGNAGGVTDFKPQVVTVDGEKRVVLSWKAANNSAVEGESRTAEYGTQTFYLRMGDNVIQADADALREASQNGENLNNLIKVGDHASEVRHYSYSEDQTAKANRTTPVQVTVVQPINKLTVSKSWTTNPSSYGGSDCFATITLNNEGNYSIGNWGSALTGEDATGTDGKIITDTLSTYLYITPNNIEQMFADKATVGTGDDARDVPVGDWLTMTIQNVSLFEPGLFQATEGVEQSNKYTSTINASPTSNPGDAGCRVYQSARMVITKNEAGKITVTLTGDTTTENNKTYVIGTGGDYESIEALFDAIGFFPTNATTYSTTYTTDDFVLAPSEKLPVVLRSSRKTTPMLLTADRESYLLSSSTSFSNTAYVRTTDTPEKTYTASTSSTSWSSELYFYKSTYQQSVSDGKIIDNYLYGYNYGPYEYDTMQFSDYMSGMQVLLVPVEQNPNLRAPGGGSLDTYTSDGINYWLLNKPGNYTNVTVGSDTRNGTQTYVAQTITVSKSGQGYSGSVMTTINWEPIEDWHTTGSSSYKGRTNIYYKSLVSPYYAGFVSSTEAASGEQYAISNRGWMGDHQGHRLYDTTSTTYAVYGAPSKSVRQIVDVTGEVTNGNRTLKNGDTVTYALSVKNLTSTPIAITGSMLRDALPNTYGFFAWTRDGEKPNVKNLRYETTKPQETTITVGTGDNQVSLNTNGEPNTYNDYWHVVWSRKAPERYSTAEGSAYEGGYDITWDNDFRVSLAGNDTLTILVDLVYMVDPTEDAGLWDHYVEQAGSIYNYFYFKNSSAYVSHSLSRTFAGNKYVVNSYKNGKGDGTDTVEDETLVKDLRVKRHQTVTYELDVTNTADIEGVFTGEMLRDALPNTYGFFAWTRGDDDVPANVENIRYVITDGGSITVGEGDDKVALDTDGAANDVDDYWHVVSSRKAPTRYSTSTNGAYEGGYDIVWDDDFIVRLDAGSTLKILVDVTFPDRPEEGPSPWDQYLEKLQGSLLYNYLYLWNNRNYNVTHTLIAEGRPVLYKGVYDTGFTTHGGGGTSAGKYTSNKSRVNYVNGGGAVKYTDTDLKAETVTYYTVVYNGSYDRMYLSDLQDQLPRGFSFNSFCNNTRSTTYLTGSDGNRSSQSATYHYSQNYVGYTGNQEYWGTNHGSYTVYRTVTEGYSNGLKLVTMNNTESEFDNNTVKYVNAGLRAIVSQGDDGREHLHFVLSQPSSAQYGSAALRYDAQVGKYYLNPGEAVRFGYNCLVGADAETDDVALNTIAMPYYDYYGTGFELHAPSERDGGAKQVVTAMSGITNNDGDCELMTAEQVSDQFAMDTTPYEEDERYNSGNEAGNWLVSQVALDRAPFIPGLIKTVGGISQSANNATPTTLQGSNGNTNTSMNGGAASRFGTAYNGSAKSSDVINWRLRVYNESGGINENIAGMMNEFTVVDTVAEPYSFTGRVFYNMFNSDASTSSPNTQSSQFLFTLGSRTLGDETVLVNSGSSVSTSSTRLHIGNAEDDEDDEWYQFGTGTKEGYVKIERLAVAREDGGDPEIKEVMTVRFVGSTYSVPGGTFMELAVHTQYMRDEVVLSEGKFNDAVLYPTHDYDYARVVQGRARTIQTYDDDGDLIRVNDGIQSGASVMLIQGFATTSWKVVTDNTNANNTARSDESDNYIDLSERHDTFRYDLYFVGPESPMAKVVLIDDLPQEGDHSAFVAADKRYSDFRVGFDPDNPNFQVKIARTKGGAETLLTNEQYRLFVSTKAEFAKEDWQGAGTGWTEITNLSGDELAEVLETARSVRVIIEDEGAWTYHANPSGYLMPNESQVHLSFNARVDDPTAQPGEIAWNSFGYTYTVPLTQNGSAANSMGLALDAQPLNVGVRFPSAPQLEKRLTDLVPKMEENDEGEPVPVVDEGGNQVMEEVPHAAESALKFGFIIYEGEAIEALDTVLDDEGVDSAQIAAALEDAGRSYLYVPFTIEEGSSKAQAELWSREFASCYDAENDTFVTDSDTPWIWVNGGRYTLLELPFGAYRFELDSTQVGKNAYPTNNVSFINSSSSITALRVANLRLHDYVDVTGSKIWDDDNDRDGKRPESITVRLLADGEELDSAEVTVEDGWTWSFEHLPKYRDTGELIEYRVVEDEVVDYETSMVETDYDEDDEVVATYEFGEDDDDGDVSEETKIAAVRHDFAITNSHEPKRIDISGTKTWDDEDYLGQPGYERPESIDVVLVGTVSNATIVSESVTVTAEDDWSYEWTNLYKYHRGEEINYRVIESVPTGFGATYDETHLNVTNTPVRREDVIEPISLDIVKIDALTGDPLGGAIFEVVDEDGLQIATIQTSDEEETLGQASVTFTSAGTYTMTETAPVGYVADPGVWTIVVTQEGVDLVEYQESEEDEGLWRWYYHLELDSESEYAEGVLTVPNPPIPIDVTVKKIWDDKSDKDGIRPDDVSFQLYRQSPLYDEKEAYGEPLILTGDGDQWTLVATELPSYENGEPLTYTVEEVEVPDGYEVTVSDDGLTITNTHEVKPEPEPEPEPNPDEPVIRRVIRYIVRALPKLGDPASIMGIGVLAGLGAVLTGRGIVRKRRERKEDEEEK